VQVLNDEFKSHTERRNARSMAKQVLLAQPVSMKGG
jgi:hypothetical protein